MGVFKNQCNFEPSFRYPTKLYALFFIIFCIAGRENYLILLKILLLYVYYMRMNKRGFRPVVIRYADALRHTCVSDMKMPDEREVKCQGELLYRRAAAWGGPEAPYR